MYQTQENKARFTSYQTAEIARGVIDEIIAGDDTHEFRYEVAPVAGNRFGIAVYEIAENDFMGML